MKCSVKNGESEQNYNFDSFARKLFYYTSYDLCTVVFRLKLIYLASLQICQFVFHQICNRIHNATSYNVWSLLYAFFFSTEEHRRKLIVQIKRCRCFSTIDTALRPITHRYMQKSTIDERKTKKKTHRTNMKTFSLDNFAMVG